ncbi:MAG: hypothetical protein JNK29_07945 [Anaerolineales bacterium]|nr:hypothetical protein [Anaerolineales bacterium]
MSRRPSALLRLTPLLVAALACSTFLPPATPAPAPSPAPAATHTPAALGASPTPPSAATLAPAATREPEAAASPPALVIHPGPQYYAGDVLSLAVTADPAWERAQVSLHLGGADGPVIVSGEFGAFGIGGRPQATFWWAWDTAGLAGEQTLTVVVTPPAGPGSAAAPGVFSQSVTLLPADQRPAPEAQARWAEARSACCVFHYLTGTAAARDIDLIRAQADQAFARVEQTLGVRQRGRVAFTLLSRLLGHGGFASDEIYLTYIDRNPAGLDLQTVFVHEGTHILDRQIADQRPTFITEGLAVFVAGGHYYPEDLDQRAAALLALDRYLPLAELARAFYPAQHEIGYLEAGAFVKYLVDTYGWERFRAMLAAFEPADDEAALLAAGLRAEYGRTLEELEAEWLAHLRAQPVDPDQVTHLRLTIALFDALRQYQLQDDPAAHFLSAWLPDGPEARRRGLVADFVRSPRAPENVALEAMLAAAEQALARRDFDLAERLINSVNGVLAAGNLFFDPLAARYLRVVTDLAARGYEAQTIDLAGPAPRAAAIRQWPILEDVPLYNSGQ